MLIRFVLLFAANKQSLVIDYNILANEQQVLAYFLPEAPSEMLKILDEVLTVCLVGFKCMINISQFSARNCDQHSSFCD